MATDATEQNTGTSNRRWLRIILMYVVPPLIALFVVLLPLLSTVSILPRIRVSPGFALLDQRGETLTSADLHGDIVVFGVVSLDCRESCEATLDAMRTAAARAAEASPDEAGGEAPGVRVVSIVADPVEDPALLARFAADHDIDAERWSVVSGSEAAVRAVVASGFEVYLAKSADGAMVHDPGVFLTDHAGFLRAEYRTGNPRADTIADDIDRIMTEATAGAVGGLLYDAAHSLSLSCGS